MVCDKLFEIINSMEEKYLQFLVDVCDIESPTENKEGVDNVGKYFIEKAKEKGWEIEEQVQTVSGNCVCITLNPKARGQAVCFSGHMDTVHPVGSFGEKPTKIVGDIVYGPGVLDCKGGIVASFMAMDALEQCGFKDRPIKLILQSDEENGSRFSNKSTVAFMAEKAKGCVAFLNTELYSEGSVSISLKGIRKYAYEISGKAAHSSVCYNGNSAILEAAHKIIQLEKYKDGNAITCNCGLINGGTAENTVPKKCTFTADFRFKNEIQGAQVEEIAKKIAEESFIEGTSCKLVLKSWRYPMEKTQANLLLYDKVNAIYKEVGLPVLTAKEANWAADSADMSHAGLPCLEGLGTQGGKIHTIEEFMYKKSLVECAKRLASVAYCIK